MNIQDDCSCQLESDCRYGCSGRRFEICKGNDRLSARYRSYVRGEFRPAPKYECEKIDTKLVSRQMASMTREERQDWRRQHT